MTISFSKLYQWIKRNSLQRLKIAIFTILTGAVLFDLSISIDFQKKTFEYDSGNSSNTILYAIFLVVVFLVVIDFVYFSSVNKENSRGKLIDILHDDSVSDEIKSEVIKLLRDK